VLTCALVIIWIVKRSRDLERRILVCPYVVEMDVAQASIVAGEKEAYNTKY
jgi:hypothetical protein